MTLRAVLSGLWSGLWAMNPRELETLARDLMRIQANGEFFANAFGTESPELPELAVEDGIAKIPIQGVILKQVPAAFRWLGIQATGTTETARAIDQAVASDDVKAIEFFVDSPGGSVAGVQELADQIYAIDKPTTAAISDLSASAAYWLASQADSVEANASALVGSIGVYSVIMDQSKAYEDEGYKVHVIRSGEHKGSFTSGTPVSDEELADEQRLIDQAAEMFTGAVARGRSMPPARVAQLATGQMWFADDARGLGLIDQIYGSADGVDQNQITTGEDPTMGDEKQIDATTEERVDEVKADLEDRINQQATELVGERQTNVALRTELEAARVALREMRDNQKSAIIDRAKSEGRITPAMVDSVQAFAGAVGQNVEALENFVDTLPVQVRPDTESQPPAGDARALLDDGDHKICEALGISPERFVEANDWSGINYDGSVVARIGEGVH